VPGMPVHEVDKISVLRLSPGVITTRTQRNLHGQAGNPARKPVSIPGNLKSLRCSRLSDLKSIDLEENQVTGLSCVVLCPGFKCRQVMQSRPGP